MKPILDHRTAISEKHQLSCEHIYTFFEVSNMCSVFWGKLMNSWGFALREGVFAENKEGICRNKSKKASFKKKSRRARVKVPYSKQDKRPHGAALLVSRLRHAKACPLGDMSQGLSLIAIAISVP